MRLEITGGRGMTSEQYASIMNGLNAFFDGYYGGAWEVVDSNLSKEGMFVAASGRQPIVNGVVPDDIEQVLLDNGYGLGYGEGQILIALFP